MRRLLQSIIHNRKRYDRPHDEWTCGRLAEGCPCICGPGTNGECRATSQCLPARQGDRWVCTRAISLGGACNPGPQPDGSCGCPVPPCRPVRSLRANRGQASWLAATLALGVGILALWGQTRLGWSNPGPLTSQHAVSAQQCTACHLETPVITMTAAARGARSLEHDELCLQCHELGPAAHSPHGLGTAELAALSREQSPPTGSSPLVLRAMRALGAPADPACASCHREHQGADFNLKLMADQQCQVCHQVQFEGFASGHPEFDGYPYVRRTRMQFDHVAHFQRHFSDARLGVRGPTSCAHCHEPAPDGGKMLVRGFEQGCAPCHSTQIEGANRAGVKGIAFLRLPGIDLAALAQAGHETGEWPVDSEGGITPFMRWLLEGDEAASAALESLGAMNPGNLQAATAEQKAAAAQLLWSIKGLFADLVVEGQPVLLRRLGATNRAVASGSIGGFPPDVALAAQQAWLPNLLAEVAAHRSGAKVPRSGVPAPAHPVPVKTPAAKSDSDDLLSDDLLADPLPATPLASVPARTANPPLVAKLELHDAEGRTAVGGWYRLDESYTLLYRPEGHADEFLTAWLEGTAKNAAPTAQRIFSQLAAPDAPGVCMKCHTVDQPAAAVTATINWYTSRPQQNMHAFTRFKHAAHFSLMGDQGCMTCHTFDVAADYAGSFGANRDPAVFRSNFAPLAKSSCAACHQPERTGESCLQCHNYHTGEMKRLRTQAAEMPQDAAGSHR
jgi:hypothetical protein